MMLNLRSSNREAILRIGRAVAGIAFTLVTGLPAVAAEECPTGTYRVRTGDLPDYGFQKEVLPAGWFPDAVLPLPRDCIPCYGGASFGREDFPCPGNRLKAPDTGFCDGRGDYDVQRCVEVHDQQPPRPRVQCPVGSFLRPDQPASPASDYPVEWQLPPTGLPAGCKACQGGAGYRGARGQTRSEKLCDGTTLFDTQNYLWHDPPPYGLFVGDRDYVCQEGYFKTGPSLDGSGLEDTMGCQICGFGGPDFTCPAFHRKGSARTCSGASWFDTNTCIACDNGGSSNTYRCDAGEFKSGATCSGDSTDDTQTCSACEGGAGWNCGSGSRRATGPGIGQCTGTGTEDTQECLACGNSEGGVYQCEAGDYKSGSTCNGTTSVDSQTCTSCAATGAVIAPANRCAPGQRRVGLECTGPASVHEICETCGNGGASYDCGEGSFRSGALCLGGPVASSETTPDTQTCASCSGGESYDCGTGNRRTGSTCGGTGHGDSQTCTACNGGAGYDCGAGVRNGTSCAGDSAADTQTCEGCSSCPDGMFQTAACTSEQDTQCDYCPYTCATCTDGSTCTSCYEGYSYRSGNTCLECSNGCPAGEYVTGACTASQDTQCGTCEPGTYTDGTGFADRCLACPAGTFASDYGASHCEPCPEGATSEEGAASCTGPTTTTEEPTTTTTLEEPTTTTLPETTTTTLPETTTTTLETPTTTTLVEATTTTLEVTTTTLAEPTTTTTLADATTTTLVEATTTTMEELTTTTTMEEPTTTLPPTTSTTLPWGCAPTPVAGCRRSAEGASSLQIRNAEDRSSWKWSWKKGDATDVADFHAPDAGASVYRVCLYDASAAAQPVASMELPSDGQCDGNSCWKAAGATGFKFKSRDAFPDGITGVSLKSGVGGKASVQVKGKGSLLALPLMPMNLPVTVQLVVESGGESECWETTFASATANTQEAFKAKGD